jgi:hypothetical protein
MMWLVQMLQDKLKGTQAAATCQYPIAMKGKSLTAMTETDFHCSEYHVNIEEPVSVQSLLFRPVSTYLVMLLSQSCVFWDQSFKRKFKILPRVINHCLNVLSLFEKI